MLAPIIHIGINIQVESEGWGGGSGTGGGLGLLELWFLPPPVMVMTSALTPYPALMEYKLQYIPPMSRY